MPHHPSPLAGEGGRRSLADEGAREAPARVDIEYNIRALISPPQHKLCGESSASRSPRIRLALRATFARQGRRTRAERLCLLFCEFLAAKHGKVGFSLCGRKWHEGPDDDVLMLLRICQAVKSNQLINSGREQKRREYLSAIYNVPCVL